MQGIKGYRLFYSMKSSKYFLSLLSPTIYPEVPLVLDYMISNNCCPVPLSILYQSKIVKKKKKCPDGFLVDIKQQLFQVLVRSFNPKAQNSDSGRNVMRSLWRVGAGTRHCFLSQKS